MSFVGSSLCYASDFLMLSANHINLCSVTVHVSTFKQFIFDFQVIRKLLIFLIFFICNPHVSCAGDNQLLFQNTTLQHSIPKISKGHVDSLNLSSSFIA